MRLYQLHDSVHKQSRETTIKKVEYFWHYWDFLFTENRNLILVHEPKFTSQLSLIDKILKHLIWNNGFSASKLIKYFNQHIYFNRKNLILRGNSELLQKIRDIKKYIENCEIDSNELKYLKTRDREYLINAFTYLKNEFFESDDYSHVLIDKLDKIVFNNKVLNENCRADLKFLCNSIIDILILKGYSLAFIKSLLSEKILHRSNKISFKYEKNSNDFDNHKDWKEYVSEQYKLISFKDRINYLKTFMIEPKRKGFCIFKIEGVDFQSEPIDVFHSKFYNPEIDKVLNFYQTKNSIMREEDYNYYSQCELFNLDENGTSNSKCNLIVPTEYNIEDIYHYDSFKFPTKSFIEASNRAKVSLLEFKRILKSFSTEYFFDEGLANFRISNESILVDEDYNYHKKSNNVDSNRITFKLDDIRKSMLDEQLIYKGNLQSESSFSIHLANSNALISSYELEYHKFNFKSLWIECIEPYFNDVNDFIDYAKKSIRIRANFFTNYRILLSHALKNDLFSYGKYSLDTSNMENIGLGELNIGESIIGDKLQKKFELIPDESLLCEFKDEMRLFVTDESKFLNKIDSWLTDTIRIAYDERNIEVHYNIVDYYNDVSIKKDILFICGCVIGAFNNVIFNPNINTAEDAKNQISKTLNDLESEIRY